MLLMGSSRGSTSPKIAIEVVADHVKKGRWSLQSFVPASWYRREFVRRVKVGADELNGVRIKLANSSDEREQAFRLVQASYVDRGISTPTRSGLRFSPFHVLPGSSTLIAEKEGRVIGTISLVEDSPIGLPMEVIHPAEVAGLRHKNRRFAEVGTLSVTPEARGRGVPLMLYNALFRWARHHRMLENLVVAVHPRVRNFYCNGLLFERLGPDQKYHALNGALSTPLQIDLAGALHRYRRIYDRATMEFSMAGSRTNLYQFFVKEVMGCVDLPSSQHFPYDLSRPPSWSEEEVDAHLLACRVELRSLPIQVRRVLLGLYPGLDELQQDLGRSAG